jgi:hypothetical protein
MQQRGSGPVAAGGRHSDNSSMPPRPRIIHSMIVICWSSRRRSRSDKARRRAVERWRRRSRGRWRARDPRQGWRPDHRHVSSALVWRPDQRELPTDRLGANLDGMLAEYAVMSDEALVSNLISEPMTTATVFCHERCNGSVSQKCGLAQPKAASRDRVRGRLRVTGRRGHARRSVRSTGRRGLTGDQGSVAGMPSMSWRCSGSSGSSPQSSMMSSLTRPRARASCTLE